MLKTQMRHLYYILERRNLYKTKPNIILKKISNNLINI